MIAEKWSISRTIYFTTVLALSQIKFAKTTVINFVISDRLHVRPSILLFESNNSSHAERTRVKVNSCKF